MMKLNTGAPYRYFFPFSIAGVILGLGQFLFSYDAPGIVWHREVMITLFLLPAAAGFLYTASPRFLKSKPAGEREIIALAACLLFLFLSYFADALSVFYLLKFAAIAMIFVFFVFRWWNRGADNAYWPPFILTSLVLGLLSSIAQIAATFISLPGWLVTAADHMYYDAMFWVLLFGIGLKFFPMLTGAVAPVYKQGRFSLISKTTYEKETVWFAVALLAAISFLIQEFIPPVWGLSLRALLVAFMAYQGWALFETPLRKGFTTNMLRLFLAVIVLAHFAFILYPYQLAHLYHVIFVGGFLALTLAVESRVILSHEHLELGYEQESKWQLSAYIFFLIAMVIRVMAIFIPAHYPLMLHFASGLALTGVLVILIKIGKMLIDKNTQ